MYVLCEKVKEEEKEKMKKRKHRAHTGCVERARVKDVLRPLKDPHREEVGREEGRKKKKRRRRRWKKMKRCLLFWFGACFVKMFEWLVSGGRAVEL